MKYLGVTFSDGKYATPAEIMAKQWAEYLHRTQCVRCGRFIKTVIPHYNDSYICHGCQERDRGIV